MTLVFRKFRGVSGLHSLTGLLLYIMASIMLTACVTVGPDYTAPDLNPPIHWNGEMGSRMSSDPLDPIALNEWWATLQDPTLTRLIKTATEGNLSLRDAEARTREARAKRGASDTNKFPSLNASGTVGRNRISENSFYEGTSYAGSTNTLYDGGFDASWEVDMFGRIQRQVEVAQAGLEASEEHYRDVLVTLLAEIALNYLDVRTQQARLSVAEANRDSQERTVDLVSTGVNVGEFAMLDLEQARTNLESTRAGIPSLEITLAQAKNRLAILLGKPPGTLNEELSERLPIPLAPAKVAIGVPADALRRRPDIREAERKLAAESAKIGVATADLYPSLSLFGSVGLETLNSGDFLSSASRVFGLGTFFQWNVFDVGRTRSNIEIASAQQEQALIAYEAAILTALQDVENSIVAYGKEMVRRQSLIEGEQSAKRALAIAEDRYKAGETSFMSVLDSMRSLLNLQDQLALSNGQVTTNVISLFKALGGGWTPLPQETL